MENFVKDTCREMGLGSDIMLPSLELTKKIGWMKARPSTIANVLVVLVASGAGEELENRVIKERVTTRPTLITWSAFLRKELSI